MRIKNFKLKNLLDSVVRDHNMVFSGVDDEDILQLERKLAFSEQ
jgi:hypothetical protein